LIGDGDDDDGGGSVGGDEMYKRSAEPVLVLFSDSYSNDDRILGR